MPTLDEYLYEIDSGLRKKGYPEMDRSTLAELAKHLKHPEVLNAIRSGKLTTDQIVIEAMHAMEQTGQRPPSDVSAFAEGGIINDSSGAITGQLRQKGFQMQPQSAYGVMPNPQPLLNANQGLLRGRLNQRLQVT